ncbi:isocitrate lyase/PEP mutase family protein [Actinopolymorpha pittospori]|uniref:2-methylisocitrate lyase-like PEP mutase family enzyme n=1 Tax=Actinopolymorpha pittospori TaxID=648752 RepID=A0A927MXE3_9ACTN|nr:isocitrate lyase/phosphoenolpyruvate mutase family protein [Actinopolymorpha pittospori]MBE1607043.1 2-methylisocitrate lyase-like PEP mutase family enzyme [Actinopolymorpha pittospori]
MDVPRTTFRELHDDDLPLLLPNAWDVASALAFVDAGFPAIGTTSFGVVASAGRPDGGRSSKEPTRALARVLAVLPAHISADIEDGYDDDPEQVADYVAGLGVAGVNIEDSSAERLVAPSAHAAKVAAVKRRRPDVYVNARVDTYWLGQEAGISETLRRANAYVEAGADGIFVPGVSAPADLRELTAHVPVPVNVLVAPGLSLSALAKLGVRRVSTGSLPYRAAVDAAVAVATSVRAERAVPAATSVPSYADMQRRLVHFQTLSARSA